MQETMVPPLFETLMEVMAVPTARVKEEGENVMEGATSIVVKVMVVEAEPAELFDQTVYVVDGVTASGVPQMLPLLVPKKSPEGSVPLMAHVETSPPVLLGTMVETVLSLV